MLGGQERIYGGEINCIGPTNSIVGIYGVGEQVTNDDFEALGVKLTLIGGSSNTVITPFATLSTPVQYYNCIVNGLVVNTQMNDPLSLKPRTFTLQWYTVIGNPIP